MTMDLFLFHIDFFLSFITNKTFTGLDYISNTVGVLLETGTAYAL